MSTAADDAESLLVPVVPDVFALAAGVCEFDWQAANSATAVKSISRFLFIIGFDVL